ncbi:hypothetical protein [Streptomyces sp. NPDC090025]|uniref:hypothetical protein n=1 Tax=Streptomyces sp. NPDC090025 TaxID=3365922 RepID=UPI0038336473
MSVRLRVRELVCAAFIGAMTLTVAVVVDGSTATVTGADHTGWDTPPVTGGTVVSAAGPTTEVPPPVTKEHTGWDVTPTGGAV